MLIHTYTQVSICMCAKGQDTKHIFFTGGCSQTDTESHGSRETSVCAQKYLVSFSPVFGCFNMDVYYLFIQCLATVEINERDLYSYT